MSLVDLQKGAMASAAIRNNGGGTWAPRCQPYTHPPPYRWQAPVLLPSALSSQLIDDAVFCRALQPCHVLDYPLACGQVWSPLPCPCQGDQRLVWVDGQDEGGEEMAAKKKTTLQYE